MSSGSLNRLRHSSIGESKGHNAGRVSPTSAPIRIPRRAQDRSHGERSGGGASQHHQQPLLLQDKCSLGTDARSLGTDKYSLGTASKTKQCPHCSGKSHGSLGAAGCTEGRAWLKTKAGRKFTENKAKKQAAKKAKLDESQATLHAFKKNRTALTIPIAIAVQRYAAVDERNYICGPTIFVVKSVQHLLSASFHTPPKHNIGCQ
eukprot:COSAG02_NODE_250_length_27076_cov_24.440618_6_plen_204_part_00